MSGMNIIFSDASFVTLLVRYVIHYDLPKSFEGTRTVPAFSFKTQFLDANDYAQGITKKQV